MHEMTQTLRKICRAFRLNCSCFNELTTVFCIVNGDNDFRQLKVNRKTRDAQEEDGHEEGSLREEME